MWPLRADGLAMVEDTSRVEVAEERWPTLMSVLREYFPSVDYPRGGPRGDDADLLARFSAVGGEESAQFIGLEEDLLDAVRHPVAAAGALNALFGSDLEPSRVRQFLVDLHARLYVDLDADGFTGEPVERSELFGAYSRRVIMRVPGWVPGAFPSWWRPASLAGESLGGAPVPALVCLLFFVALALLALGVNRLAEMAGQSWPRYVSMPVLLVGAIGAVYSAAMMWFTRNALLRPDVEEEAQEEAEEKRPRRWLLGR